MAHNSSINYAENIISLAQKDLHLRRLLSEKGLLSENYHPDMEALHIMTQRLLIKS